jgi:DNA ligase-1
MDNLLATNTFFEFCLLLQQISETKSTKKKAELFGEALQQTSDVGQACLMAQFVGEGVFSSTNTSTLRATIGPKLAAECCSEVCTIDYELVFKPCKQATGSGSEAIALLLTNMTSSTQQARLNPTLTELVEMAVQLSKLKKKVDKHALVIEWMQQLPPICVRYLIRIFSQRSLRIGFELRSVLQAIAVATSSELQAVRYAHLVTGSLAKTTELAFQKRLHEARFEPFHPMAFMLASPATIKEFEAKGEEYTAEEKLDGMRAQIHISGSTVAIYSRDMNDISNSFPDLVSYFATKMMPTTVLDGEIVVLIDGAIQPFRLLQQRMGVKKPTKKLLEDYPVHFVAYDLLFADERTYFEWILSKRRTKLEAVCQDHNLSITKQYDLPIFSDNGTEQQREKLSVLFTKALSHGNEGLMLKAKHSVYEYGQRKKSWLKIKEPVGNLDTVIMYAHAGSGKRGGLYSDFTLGISVSDDDRFDEDFIPIGKAYGGFTDAELKRLNVEIKKRALQRFGPTLSVKAELVVELEFEQIMLNKRTKAGYTLRLPRFRAIRWDKNASQINTLKDVEEMYSSDDGLREKGAVDDQGFL